MNRRTFSWKSMLIGAALAMAGCGGYSGTFEIPGLNLADRLPLQFTTPRSLPTLTGQVSGLAAGNFDGTGRADLATYLDQRPGQPADSGQVVVFQGGIDPVLPRLDLTAPLVLQRVRSLTTTPAGDLVAASSNLLPNNFGLVRMKPPLVNGAFVPGPNDRQVGAPFPDLMARDAKLASLRVGAVTMLAVPGVYPGPAPAVCIHSTVNMEQAVIGTNFIPTAAIATPNAVAAGDFNGDGLDDLAVQGSGIVQIYSQQAGGNFALTATVPVSAAATDVFAGNLDKIARADLVVSTVNGLEIYLNGDFSKPAITRPLPAAREVNCADLNGDGILDVFGVFGVDRQFLYAGLGAGDGSFPTIIPGDVGSDTTTELHNVRALQYSGLGAIDLAVVLRANASQLNPSGKVVVAPIVFP